MPSQLRWPGRVGLVGLIGWVPRRGSRMMCRGERMSSGTPLPAGTHELLVHLASSQSRFKPPGRKH